MLAVLSIGRETTTAAAASPTIGQSTELRWPLVAGLQSSGGQAESILVPSLAWQKANDQ